MADFVVTKIAKRYEGHNEEDLYWDLEGTITLAGDTYTVVYEHAEDFMDGERSLSVQLDGVEQGDDTYIMRVLGEDLITDECVEALGEVWEAAQAAEDRQVAAMLRVTRTIAPLEDA